jgi:hypothetical protein
MARDGRTILPDVEGYDTAQICRNGHVINEMAARNPQHNQPFCDKCGSPTIAACDACGVSIRGYYHSPVAFLSGSTMQAPAYCHTCGEPYPWTATALDAARDLADELDGLNAEDRVALKGTLDDLVKDGPRTQVASLRFKKLAAKTGHEGARMLKAALYAVVTEASKRAIWGP